MRVLLFLIVGGCWRGGETAETKPSEPVVPVARVKGASCEEVATSSRALLHGSTDEKLRGRADQIAKIIYRRCNADGWSIELRRCLAGAKTVDDTDGCEKLATEAQEEALENDVELTENAD